MSMAPLEKAASICLTLLAEEGVVSGWERNLSHPMSNARFVRPEAEDSPSIAFAKVKKGRQSHSADSKHSIRRMALTPFCMIIIFYT